MSTMVSGQFFPSQDAQNIYDTKYFDCIDHSNMNYSELQDGSYEVDISLVHILSVSKCGRFWV